MNLQQVKELVNNAEFSEEASKAINEILDKAIERGYLTVDEKDKILKIIDIEIETASIKADTLEKIASALESFADEIDMVLERTGDEIEAINKDLESLSNRLKSKRGFKTGEYHQN